MLPWKTKDPTRVYFGEREKAWLVVEISDDNRTAYLREVCFSGNGSLGKEDILRVLAESYRIVAGINEDVLDRIVERVLAEPERTFRGRGDVVLAEEVEARGSEDGGVQYKFLDMVTRKVVLPYRALRDAFEKEQMEEVVAVDLEVRPTPPGSTITIRTEPQKGRPGQNIFGAVTTLVPAPKTISMKAGRFVEEEEDRFIARIFGYVCVLDGAISIIPPIWVSPDGFEAHYIHFPHVGPQILPEASWLDDVLSVLGIPFELETRAMNELNRLLAGWRTRKATYLLLQGTRPAHGENSRFDLAFGTAVDSLSDAPEGETRLDALKEAATVRTGQLLARVLPPEVGEEGCDLRGEPIPAMDGEEVEFEIGQNVRVE